MGKVVEKLQAFNTNMEKAGKSQAFDKNENIEEDDKHEKDEKMAEDTED